MKSLNRILILFALLSGAVTAKPEIDISKFIQECQIMRQKETRITMVWWMPYNYWEVVLANDPRITGEQVQSIISMLRELTIFAVVDAEFGPFGGMTPKPREDIVANSSLKVEGEFIPYLEMESLKPDARNLFTIMKPMMAEMIGQVGQGMEFLVFSNKAEGGGLIVDAKEAGSFTFTGFDEEFTWRLPLGSLLDPRIDPETGEQFPGNYQYNPFTGSKLVDGK